MHISFTNQTDKKVDTGMLERYGRKAAQLLSKRLATYCPPGASVDDLGLEVFFVTDPMIRKLNKQHRGKDSPTDVISVSFVEDREFTPWMLGSEAYPAGEIFLSVDMVARQARENDIPFMHEMSYMLVHGFLHVFGYDHEDDAEEREMERASLEVLGGVYPRRKEFGF